jgi:hypothetical protein
MTNQLSGDAFFAANPGKVLGTETEINSRYGQAMYSVVGSAQEALNRIPVVAAAPVYGADVPAGRLAGVPVRLPAGTPNEANLEAAITKTQKTTRARKTGTTPPGGELLTFEEVFAAYNPGITEEEVRVWVWYQTRPGGWMNRAHISQPGNGWGKYLVSTPNLQAWHAAGLVAWDGVGYVPSVLYYGGDVRKKMRQMQAGDGSAFLKELTADEYADQLARLEAAAPPMLRLVDATAANRLVLDPRTDFCKENGLAEQFASWLWQMSGTEIKAAYGVTGDEVRAALAMKAIRSKTENKEAKAMQKGEADKAMLDLFSQFLESVDEEFLLTVQKEWNEQYHTIAPYDYSRIPVGFEAGRLFKRAPLFIRPAQREGVAFLSVEGSGIVAYDLGVGKTMTAILYIAQAMYAGMMNRPILVVPKNVYKKWINEMRGTENSAGEKIHGLIPNVPIYELGNLSDEYVRNLPITNGKIDIPEKQCVLIATEEGMSRIGFTDATGAKLTDLMANILDQNYKPNGEMSKKSLRDAEAFNETIQKVVYGALMNTSINIEELKADGFITDETHHYKNLFPGVKGDIVGQKETSSGDTKDIRSSTPFEISGPTPSGRAIKAFLLSYYVAEGNNNRNVVGLTATPFNNSPLEIYAMLALIAFRRLDELGILNLKSFFEAFVTETYEVAVTTRGTLKTKAIIKSYRNLPVLQSLIFKFMNYKTGEDAGIERPEKVVLPILQRDGKELPEKEQVSTLVAPTGLQLTLLQATQGLGLGSFIDGFVNTDEDGNVMAADLLCVSFSKQVALSPFLFKTAELGSILDLFDRQFDLCERLYLGEDRDELMEIYDQNAKKGPDAYYYPISTIGKIRVEMAEALGKRYRKFEEIPSKILVESSPKLRYVAGCIESVVNYHKANKEPLSCQVIYMGSGLELYEPFRDYLVQQGIFRKDQIGFITGEVSQDKREKIKEDFLDPKGTIRLIMGSDAILVGVDLQNQSSALYNVTLPWNPTDLRQVEGRIWRFGNIYQWVRIVNPIVENSSDAFQYQLLYEKGARINSVLTRGQGQSVFDIEDVDFSKMRDMIITDPKVKAIRALNKEKQLLQIEYDGLFQAKNDLRNIKEKAADYVNKRKAVDSFIAEELAKIPEPERSEIKMDSIVSIKAAIRKNMIRLGTQYAYDSWERYTYSPYQSAKEWMSRRILSEKKRMERAGNMVGAEAVTDVSILQGIDSTTVIGIEERIAAIEKRAQEVKGEGYLKELEEVFAEQQIREARTRRSIPDLVGAFASLNHLLSCTSITGKLCDVKGIVGSVPKQKQVVLPMPAQPATPELTGLPKDSGSRPVSSPAAPAPTRAQLEAQGRLLARLIAKTDTDAQAPLLAQQRLLNRLIGKLAA